jgi:hypothetical protein
MLTVEGLNVAIQQTMILHGIDLPFRRTPLPG